MITALICAAVLIVVVLVGLVWFKSKNKQPETVYPDVHADRYTTFSSDTPQVAPVKANVIRKTPLHEARRQAVTSEPLVFPTYTSSYDGYTTHDTSQDCSVDTSYSSTYTDTSSTDTSSSCDSGGGYDGS